MPTQYYYAGTLLPEVTNVTVGVPARAQGFATPGVPGSRPPGSFNADSRAITVDGVIINPPGNTIDDLQAAWSAFVSAHHMAVEDGTPGWLAIDTGFHYLAFPETMNDTKTDYGSKEYSITYRCYDPFRYKDTATTSAGRTSNGTTSITSDSQMTTPLSMAFTVTHVGTIMFTDSVYGDTLTLTLDVTGDWVIDGLARTIVCAGVDKFANLALQSKFLKMPGIASSGSRANVITMTLSDSAALSASTYSWTPRSL